MTRFVVGDDRSQSTLFPERLEDYLSEDNPDYRRRARRLDARAWDEAIALERPLRANSFPE
jgi:hypothetical protein